MCKTFVISDIHGAYKALLECIEKSGIDKQKDTLIFLGDVADGWPDVKECIDELMTFENLIHIIGNHDEWTFEWLGRKQTDLRMSDYNWVEQGGMATVHSLKNTDRSVYYDFFKKAKSYHEQDNMLFMHGGFDDSRPINEQSRSHIMWDRDLVKKAKRSKTTLSTYDYIFIGHTPTVYLESVKTPLNYSNVWAIDTGASYDGPLTIMNVDTKEYFQSSNVVNLYPGIKAR